MGAAAVVLMGLGMLLAWGISIIPQVPVRLRVKPALVSKDVLSERTVNDLLVALRMASGVEFVPGSGEGQPPCTVVSPRLYRPVSQTGKATLVIDLNDASGAVIRSEPITLHSTSKPSHMERMVMAGVFETLEALGVRTEPRDRQKIWAVFTDEEFSRSLQAAPDQVRVGAAQDSPRHEELAATVYSPWYARPIFGSWVREAHANGGRCSDQEVRKLLRRYGDAIATEDPKKVASTSIYASVDDGLEQAWANYFETVGAVDHVDFPQLRIEDADDAVRVSARRVDHVAPTADEPDPLELDIWVAFRVKRVGGECRLVRG
jgi:hypothetical protein